MLQPLLIYHHLLSNLQLEDLDGILSKEFCEQTKNFLSVSGGVTTSDRAIHQHHLYLLDGVGVPKLQSFAALCAEAGGRDNRPVSGGMLKTVSKLCQEVQASTFSILFHPIRDQLDVVVHPNTVEKIWLSPYAGSDSRYYLHVVCVIVVVCGNICQAFLFPTFLNANKS